MLGQLVPKEKLIEMSSASRHLQCKNVMPPEWITSSSSGCNHDSTPSHCPKWKWNATAPSFLSTPTAAVQWNEIGNVLCNNGEPMNVVQNGSRTGFRSDTRIMLDNQAVDTPLGSN